MDYQEGTGKEDTESGHRDEQWKHATEKAKRSRKQRTPKSTEYHNHEQKRSSAHRAPAVVPPDCSDAGLVVGVTALVVTIALAVLTAHTIYEHHVQGVGNTSLALKDVSNFSWGSCREPEPHIERRIKFV